jgi:mRNA-degrading endonuclease toxin of MazEF toxin-antitoxin module
MFRVSGVRGETKPSRVYVVVSRQSFLDAKHSAVACVPVFSNFHGLATEVLLDESHGLKHTSTAQCDLVTSLPRAILSNFVGSLSETKMREVSRAMALALGIGARDIEDL